MEEILASIRRIIADDQSLPGNRRDREERRQRDADATEAPVSAEHAYSEPALDATSAPVADDEVESVEDDAPPPAVAEIRHLRLNRVVEQAAPVTQDEDEDEDEPLDEGDDDEDFAAFDSGEMATAVGARVDEALVSSSTASSVASHFEALAASMILNDEGVLRQYAQEMMRPMLKQWLDDNLPTIVERLVRAEIERVARGGRR
jgi:uncharacterized protein